MSKIPEHAKRVFKGIIYDVYHWEQELFDGSTATFERLKRPDSALVIALQGETVFYIKQDQPDRLGYMSLLGGRIDEGEDPLDAAKRELLEESGMASDDWDLFNKYSMPGKVDWDIYIYIAKDCKKIAEQKLDAGERVEVCSCHIDEFLTKIVPAENFFELELKQELLAALDMPAVERIKKQILR